MIALRGLVRTFEAIRDGFVWLWEGGFKPVAKALFVFCGILILMILAVALLAGLIAAIRTIP